MVLKGRLGLRSAPPPPGEPKSAHVDEEEPVELRLLNFARAPIDSSSICPPVDDEGACDAHCSLSQNSAGPASRGGGGGVDRGVDSTVALAPAYPPPMPGAGSPRPLPSEGDGAPLARRPLAMLSWRVGL